MIGHGVYTIEMETSLLSSSDEISFQEIHFEDCNPKRTALDCDFEGGNFCLWKLDAKSPLQWNIVEAMDVLNTAGHSVYLPTVDHTTRSSKGHYAWTQKANVTGNQSPVAVIKSPVLSANVCISLWYYMDGASFLQLSITSKSTFSGARNRDILNGPSGGVWKFKQSNVKRMTSDYTISIEAQIEDTEGIIAIDDVRMKCKWNLPFVRKSSVFVFINFLMFTSIYLSNNLLQMAPVTIHCAPLRRATAATASPSPRAPTPAGH